MPDYSTEIRACCTTNRHRPHAVDCSRQTGRCRTKTAYASKAEALATWGISGADPLFMAYRCYSCDLWHVGRPSERERS